MVQVSDQKFILSDHAIAGGLHLLNLGLDHEYAGLDNYRDAVQQTLADLVVRGWTVVPPEKEIEPPDMRPKITLGEFLALREPKQSGDRTNANSTTTSV